MSKTIVVSGGTKGIGKSIVEHFFRQGFDVAFCARNAEQINQLKNKLYSINPDQKVLGVTCDLSDKEDVKNFATNVLYEFDRIDVLVNNAGVFLPGQIGNEEDGVFEQVMNTNVASAYHLTRALLPQMQQLKNGYVFNMCSTASITAYTNGGSYCISKYALLGMTKVLREETKAQGIQVTAVLPGATYTDSWAGSDLPPERFIQPGDIARMIWNCWELRHSAVVEELLIRPQLGDI